MFYSFTCSLKSVGSDTSCSVIAEVSFEVAKIESWCSRSEIDGGEMIHIPPSLGGRDRRNLSSSVTLLPSVRAGINFDLMAFSRGLRRPEYLCLILEVNAT